MVSSLPGLFVHVNLGECRYGVCPGLNLCPDSFIRIGCEGHPVPAEGHIEQFAIRVMALDSCTVRLIVRVPDSCATIGS